MNICAKIPLRCFWEWDAMRSQQAWPLTFDLPKLQISSSSGQSEPLLQIWINPFKAILRYHVHKCGWTIGQPVNITPLDTARWHRGMKRSTENLWLVFWQYCVPPSLHYRHYSHQVFTGKSTKTKRYAEFALSRASQPWQKVTTMSALKDFSCCGLEHQADTA